MIYLEKTAMTELENHPRTPREYLRLFLTGMAMGTADPIPGVSGGTMAFILGVYEDLLRSIKSFDLTLLKMLLRFDIKSAMQHVPWRFLLALGLGIVLAFLMLANIIDWLLLNERVYLFAFFFGLILASILAIGARLRWVPLNGLMLVVGVVVALFIVTRIPVDMPHDPLTLFLSGMIAIVAMILPGISGSFILLILGQYEFVIGAVKDLDILVILPVAVGSVVGLLTFARILSWLLSRYEHPTIAVLVGFMIGSLYEIWPWKVVLETRIDRHGDVVPMVEANMLPNFAGSEFWLALALCVAGFFLVSFLDHLQSRANPVFTLGRIRRGASPLPGTDG
jgi:putative membrane protein